ncbi:MAG: 2,3-butanediol dehydrogenase [Dehalococcoidia bacterium]|nr:2,3-butanediol dehydrogenase [Dehalococcoidia bacterium]
MKALRWYARKDLRYEDVPEPSPGPGQVKVKIHLAGICGTDLKEYEAGPGMIAVDKVPLTLGHEFAGTVEEVGEGVTNFKVGERVTGVGYWFCGECYYCKRSLYNLCINGGFTGLTVDGCMAEYVVVPSYSVYKLPDSVSDEAGALVEPLAVALHAVRQGNVRPGDTVAIVGSGTIGLCVLLAARAAGASEVYVVDKIKRRGEIALAMGATAFINPNDGDPVKLIVNLTDGLGVDVSFECVGHPDTPQLSVDLARRGGTTVIVGVFDKPSSFHFQSVMFNQKTMVGSPIYVHEAKTVIALLADKRIDPRRLITSKVPLKDAVEMGFEKLIVNKEDNIKILLQIA